MPESSRFSFWLVPDGDAADAYQAVIDRLAREHGGPVFSPHLTLFGSVTIDEADALNRAQRLAAGAAPFTVEVDGIEVDTTYFQSLFATVRPTDALLALRQAAEQTFDAPPGERYRPHVSLLYGFYPDDVKQAIVHDLRRSLPPSFVTRTLLVNQSGDTVADWRTALRLGLGG
jgi:2'-5' RNA ligase